MKESRQHLLQLIYNHEQEKGSPFTIASNASNTPFDVQTLRNDIHYLKSHDYIEENIDVPPSVYCLMLTEKGECLVEAGFHTPSETVSPVSNVFHIENATNSVIGTQENVTLNIGDTLQEIKEQIDSSNSNDKQELRELINLLEKTMNNETSIKKGAFSRFAGIIQKNSWIASPIASVVLKWIISQA